MSVQGPANEAGTPLGRLGDLRPKPLKLEAGIEKLRRIPEPPVLSIAPHVTPDRIRQVIKARRARELMFGAGLFADPAWDLLLESYLADLTQTRLSVSALCDRAAVPATTATRWLQTLEQQGWLGRKRDPLDARRTWVELTHRGSARMAQYFNTIWPDVISI